MAGKDPRAIGKRIAKRRHQLGWSQVEFAGRLGVSPSTVANWERGASYPKKKLGKVEQVLGLTLDDEPGGSVLDERWGREDADRVRRVLSARPDGAAILREMEEAFRPTPPGEEQSGPSRRAG